MKNKILGVILSAAACLTAGGTIAGGIMQRPEKTILELLPGQAGDLYGDYLGSGMDSLLGGALGDELGSELSDALGSELGSGLGDLLGGALDGELGDAFYNELGDALTNGLDSDLYSEWDNYINNNSEDIEDAIDELQQGILDGLSRMDW